MKKGILSFLTVMVVLAIISWRPEPKNGKALQVYGVAFYNLENLFDTLHDEGKNDYEYLPNGANRWGALKYTNKLKNMAQVEHSRHRSVANFLCNTFAAIAAYCYFPKKPALNLEFEESNQLCLF